MMAPLHPDEAKAVVEKAYGHKVSAATLRPGQTDGVFSINPNYDPKVRGFGVRDGAARLAALGTPVQA